MADPGLLLKQSSSENLLKTFAALTHRMHAARDKKDPFLENNLRVSRNLVEDEILRRMKP